MLHFNQSGETKRGEFEGAQERIHSVSFCGVIMRCSATNIEECEPNDRRGLVILNVSCVAPPALLSEGPSYLVRPVSLRFAHFRVSFGLNGAYWAGGRLLVDTGTCMWH